VRVENVKRYVSSRQGRGSKGGRGRRGPFLATCLRTRVASEGLGQCNRGKAMEKDAGSCFSPVSLCLFRVQVVMTTLTGGVMGRHDSDVRLG
jgi:hypothetical protein